MNLSGSDHSPEKIHFVKESLVKFSNAHLARLGYEVTDLETDFADGVRLILLLGSLEGYFVPFHSFHLKPETVEEKLQNVSHSFSMMEEAGLPMAEEPKIPREDLVNWVKGGIVWL